jgi:hypothetical protein
MQSLAWPHEVRQSLELAQVKLPGQAPGGPGTQDPSEQALGVSRLESQLGVPQAPERYRQAPVSSHWAAPQTGSAPQLGCVQQIFPKHCPEAQSVGALQREPPIPFAAGLAAPHPTRGPQAVASKMHDARKILFTAFLPLTTLREG